MEGFSFQQDRLTDERRRNAYHRRIFLCVLIMTAQGISQISHQLLQRAPFWLPRHVHRVLPYKTANEVQSRLARFMPQFPLSRGIGMRCSKEDASMF